MITITVENNFAIASDNGTVLKRWSVVSRPAMLTFIKKTGIEKFDLTTSDLGKSLQKKIQRAGAKATNLPDLVAPVQTEHPDIATAEPAPVPTTEATNVDGDTVEQTFVLDNGDSVTVVHPAQ